MDLRASWAVSENPDEKKEPRMDADRRGFLARVLESGKAIPVIHALQIDLETTGKITP